MKAGFWMRVKLAAGLLAAVLAGRTAIGGRTHCLLAAEAPRATVLAKSGSPADLQAAVSRADAGGGGTVRIPEGKFVFTPAKKGAVIVPGGVNILGAGKDKTVLYVKDEAADMSGFFRVDGRKRNGKPVRISGVTLRGYRADHPNIDGGRYPGIEIHEVTDFRVDHCAFLDLAGRGVGVYNGDDPAIICRGVIDHCEFVNTSGNPCGPGGIIMWKDGVYPNCVGYAIAPNGTGQARFWDDNVANVLGKYGRTVVVEDCYFKRWRHVVAANQGAHYVFRHNTIEADCGFGSLDCHGGGYGREGVGTRAVEVYDNTIKPPLPEYPWKQGHFFRGGCGVIYNNTVEGYKYFVCFSNEGPHERYWPKNVWIWNNTLSPGCAEVSPGKSKVGVDYFRHAPHTFKYTPYPYPHPLTLADKQKDEKH